MTSSGQPTALSALSNITNVIVLMFENRSFDHLLGAMPGVDGVLDQATPVITEAQITGDTQPTLEQLAAPPAPHIVKVTKKYLSGLPGHPDSGKPITRTFATIGELRAYAKERRDAALAAIKKGATW